MWKYEAKNNNSFSLHDCRATRMFVDQNDLYFEYDRGFWIIANTQYNKHEKTYGSGIAQLKVCNFECSCIYIFEEIEHDGESITQRVSLDLETLMDNINSGKWKLEFLSEYHACRGVLFICCVRMQEQPYNWECQIQLYHDDIIYLWNNLCEDRIW